MTPQGQGAQLSAWGSPLEAASGPLSGLTRFIDKSLLITGMEVRKMRHDLTALFMRLAQPLLWLLIYGEVMNRTHAIPTGNLPFIDFVTPGILAQSGLFVAIFAGITVIWERDLGIVHKFVASPTPRVALSLGKALAGGLRALSGAIVIYVLAIVLGVKMDWNPLSLFGVLAAAFLGATLFCSFSLCIAFIVRTRDRMMGVGQVLTMPFFFSSAALYPASVMPRWLQIMAHGNPLSYEVDALRALMLTRGTSLYGLGMDFAVLTGVTAALIVLAGWLYPRAAA